MVVLPQRVQRLSLGGFSTGRTLDGERFGWLTGFNETLVGSAHDGLGQTVNCQCFFAGDWLCCSDALRDALETERVAAIEHARIG